jgi:hypothetical protein
MSSRSKTGFRASRFMYSRIVCRGIGMLRTAQECARSIVEIKKAPWNAHLPSSGL